MVLLHFQKAAAAATTRFWGGCTQNLQGCKGNRNWQLQAIFGKDDRLTPCAGRQKRGLMVAKTIVFKVVLATNRINACCKE
jgi:hypothetical protein